MTPHVTCVCLTADRQAMTDRAVRCFLAQTYPNKSLLILDSGKTPYHTEYSASQLGLPSNFHLSAQYIGPVKQTIGALRNWVNGCANCYFTDIIAHWDSDDWSHPLRLAWQVQRLKTKIGGNEYEGYPDSQLDAVGYRTLLFWRSTDLTAWLFTHERSTYCIGTSLTYWRKTWEANPFPERNIGEDYMWLRTVKSEGQEGFFKDEPAMVAEIHGGNTTEQTIPGDSWKRVPEWDERLKELMKL